MGTVPWVGSLETTEVDDSVIPYSTIIKCGLINRILPFLGSTYPAVINFNAVWILVNILTHVEYELLIGFISRFFHDIPIFDIIPQIITLLSRSRENAICSCCLWCLNNIIEVSVDYVPTILGYNFNSVITHLSGVFFLCSHDSQKEHDIMFQLLLLNFITLAIRDSASSFNGFQRVIDIFPLLSWLFDIKITGASSDLEERLLSMLLYICNSFQRPMQIEVLIIHLI